MSIGQGRSVSFFADCQLIRFQVRPRIGGIFFYLLPVMPLIYRISFSATRGLRRAFLARLPRSQLRNGCSRRLLAGGSEQAPAPARGRRQRSLVPQRRCRRGGFAAHRAAAVWSFRSPIRCARTIPSSSPWWRRRAARSMKRSPPRRATTTFRSMSSIAAAVELVFPPRSIAARWSLPSAPAAPRRAGRRLRERIEAALPARIGDLAALMGRYRGHFAKARHASQSLRQFWGAWSTARSARRRWPGRWRDAEAALVRAIEHATTHANSRIVFLVGAGEASRPSTLRA